MSNWPGATILSNQTTPPKEPRDYKEILKLTGTIGGLVVIVLVSLAVWKLVKNQTLQEQSKVVQEQVQEQKELSPPTFEDTHPTLFFADLEYDLKDERARLVESGTVKGDPPPLFSTPTQTPTEFPYKIEVVDINNKVLQDGWDSVPKKLATSPQNTLSLRIVTFYQPGATVKISLADGKVIWTDRIK